MCAAAPAAEFLSPAFSTPHMTDNRRPNSTEKSARILIVDDHPIVRHGLASLIEREPDLAICGEAEEAVTALQAIDALKPDLVILDLSLAGPTGMDVLKSIRAKDANMP